MVNTESREERKKREREKLKNVKGMYKNKIKEALVYRAIANTLISNSKLCTPKSLV
jgi:hypothetical protein